MKCLPSLRAGLATCVPFLLALVVAPSVSQAQTGSLVGPPQAGSCVPRKHEGGCGSLWDALKYETRIEMAGVEPGITWYDGRGWGTLPAGTMIQFPIPARELEVTRLPLYTFGGAPGSVGSASAPNYNACPVALPRCP